MAGLPTQQPQGAPKIPARVHFAEDLNHNDPQLPPNHRQLLLFQADPTGPTPVQFPYEDSPARRNVVYDLTTNVLPLLFIILFFISGTVILIFSLANHKPVPTRLLLGLTGTILIVFVSWSLLSFFRSCIKSRRQREFRARVLEAMRTGNCPMPLLERDAASKAAAEVRRKMIKQASGIDIPAPRGWMQHARDSIWSQFQIRPNGQRRQGDVEQGVRAGNESAFLGYGAEIGAHGEPLATNVATGPAQQRTPPAGESGEPSGHDARNGGRSNHQIVQPTPERDERPVQASAHNTATTTNRPRSETNCTVPVRHRISRGGMSPDSGRRSGAGQHWYQYTNNDNSRKFVSAESQHMQHIPEEPVLHEEPGEVRNRGGDASQYSGQQSYMSHQSQASTDTRVRGLSRAAFSCGDGDYPSLDPDKKTSSSTVRDSWDTIADQGGVELRAVHSNVSRPVSAMSDQPANITICADIKSQHPQIQPPATAAVVHYAGKPASTLVDYSVEGTPRMKRGNQEDLSRPAKNHKGNKELQHSRTILHREGSKQNGQSVGRMEKLSKRQKQNPQLAKFQDGGKIVDPVILEKIVSMIPIQEQTNIAHPKPVSPKKLVVDRSFPAVPSHEPYYIPFSKPGSQTPVVLEKSFTTLSNHEPSLISFSKSASRALSKKKPFASYQEYENKVRKMGDAETLPKPAHYEQEFYDQGRSYGDDGVSELGSVDPDLAVAELDGGHAVSEVEGSIIEGEIEDFGDRSRNAKTTNIFQLEDNAARPDSFVLGVALTNRQKSNLQTRGHFGNSSRVEILTSVPIMKAGHSRVSSDQFPIPQMSSTPAQSSIMSGSLRSMTSHFTSTAVTSITEQSQTMHEDAASMMSCEVRTGTEHEAVSEDRISATSNKTMSPGTGEFYKYDVTPWLDRQDRYSSEKGSYSNHDNDNGKLKQLSGADPIYEPGEVQELSDEDQSVFITQSLKKQQSMDRRDPRKRKPDKVGEAGMKSTFAVDGDSINSVLQRSNV